VLRDPVITSALIGASRPEQIIEASRAIQNHEFSETELQEIEQILKN
jgi:L-glyceraldehyde 3-phosphate reductase